MMLAKEPIWPKIGQGRVPLRASDTKVADPDCRKLLAKKLH